MTRADFLKKWRCHLVGIALYGSVSELRDGPMAKAQRALDLPEEMEKLLNKFYDDAVGPKALLAESKWAMQDQATKPPEGKP